MSDNSPDPNMEMVMMLRTNDPIALGLAEGSLDGADIPFVFSDGVRIHSGSSAYVAPYFQSSWVQILVPRDPEAEARKLVMPLLNPEPDTEPAA